MVFSFMPAQWLARLYPPGERLGRSILWSNLLLLLLFLTASRLLPSGAASPLPALCLSKSLLGLPCPGCGVTTGLMHTFRGEWGQALAQNPLALPLAGFILAQFLGQLAVFYCGLRQDTAHRAYRLIQAPLLASLLLFWGWRLLFAG